MNRIESLKAELYYEMALDDKRNNPETYDRDAFNTAAENLRAIREEERTESASAGTVNPGAIGATVENPNTGVQL